MYREQPELRGGILAGIKGSAAVVAAVMGVAAASVWSAEPLRVVTYNVRGDFDEGVATDRPNGWLSPSGDDRRELALRVVREADPDLLGVQEAYANQVREIGEALPGHDVYAVGRDDGAAGGEHCAIYHRRDRLERIDAGTFWLSDTPDTPSTYPGAACPRIASWVRLKDRRNGGAELLVVNTHWDHVSQAARLHSAGLIRERFASLAGDTPAIVMGDLNVPEESEPIQRLLGRGDLRLIDGYRAVHPERSPDEATYHAFRGGAAGSRIDYILHTAGMRTLVSSIDRTAFDGRLPSDHYPVSAKIEFAPAK